MRTFEEWMISESVTFSPVDWEAPKSTAASLSDLGHKVKDLLNRNVPETRKATNPEGIFTIDGLSPNDMKGVMNLYPTGVSEQHWSKVLQAAIYFINEFGVKHGEFRQDHSRMFDQPVYRIDVEIPQVRNFPPEVNMTNAMAVMILGAIFNEPTPEEMPEDVPEDLPEESPDSGLHGRTLSANELLWRVQSINDFTVRKMIRPQKRVGNVVHSGVDETRIRRNLESLRKLAQWCVDNGYNTIVLN